MVNVFQNRNTPDKEVHKLNEEKRIDALAKYLECEVEDLEETGYRENTYAVNPRKEKQGNPPAYYVDIVAKFKTLLTPHKISQIVEHITMADYYASQQRDKLYYTIRRYLHRYQTEKPAYKEIANKALYVENVLYHLLSNEDKDFVRNYQNAFLGVPLKDKREYRHVDSGEYMILTDEEADQEAREYIESSLWAFNASWIINHSKLPYEAEEMIQAYQEKHCDNANETIKALIEDFDNFVEESISADGRGHFLNTYDGHEHEIYTDDKEYLYIYRVS